MSIVILTVIGSFFIGILGGIFGVGGGVFLVPFLVVIGGLRPITAVGVSIFCVLGASIGATSKALGSGRVNVGLALLIEPFLVVGAILSSFIAHAIPDRMLLGLFSGLMVVLSLLFFRSVSSSSTPASRTSTSVSDAPGGLDGVFLDRSTGDVVVYRPIRVPLLGALSMLAGMASGLFGIGGGALTVPLMTFLAKVPLRAAAASSAFTMAVTGASAGVVHLTHGTVPVALVAASLIGVLPGGRIGARLQSKVSERHLRRGFSFLALIVAVVTFSRAIGGDA